jgi:hypothetical protein
MRQRNHFIRIVVVHRSEDNQHGLSRSQASVPMTIRLGFIEGGDQSAIRDGSQLPLGGTNGMEAQ